MRIPSPAELLDAWEGAISASPTRRALVLAALAHPEISIDQLALLPVGHRDTMLLELREHLFGDLLNLVTECPHCAEPLEASVRLRDLRVETAGAGEEEQLIEAGGCRVTFRLLTSADLLAIPSGIGVHAARQLLLTRCILAVRDGADEPAACATLPASVVSAITERMAMHDPNADLQLRFACPGCRHAWNCVFDIAHFLWRELHAWAQHTLRDVHVLARAYGWCEAAVLALSPSRRQVYLELCRS